ILLPSELIKYRHGQSMAFLHFPKSFYGPPNIHPEVRMKESLANISLVEHRMISYHLTSKLARHTNRRYLPCQLVEIDIVRVTYIETPVCHIDRSLSEMRELGKEFLTQANYRM